MRLRLPEFIIGGAPRSGTTWLYHLLDRHPQIVMAKPPRPEPKFFLVDDLHRQGLGYYSKRWFEGIPADKLAGEKSTNYLEGKAVAERIRAAVPHAKLIFILRNPVDRAYSNYRWSRMNGMESEDFAAALALESERERNLSPQLRFSRPHAYFSRGLYAEHLQRFFSAFPREHLLTLRFEDCAADGPGAAALVHRFLGVAPRPGDAADDLERNEADGADDMPEAVRAELVARYAEPNRRLAALLGWPDDPWRK